MSTNASNRSKSATKFGALKIKNAPVSGGELTFRDANRIVREYYRGKTEGTAKKGEVGVMVKHRTYKPGDKVPASAQVQLIGPRGGKGPERTVVKGEPFPPTPKPGQTYKIIDKSCSYSTKATRAASGAWSSRKK